MQTKIEGQMTLETAKCNYCHALKTIRDLSTKGASLPPENHLRKPAPKPAPQTPPAATTKPPAGM